MPLRTMFSRESAALCGMCRFQNGSLNGYHCSSYDVCERIGVLCGRSRRGLYGTGRAIVTSLQTRALCPAWPHTATVPPSARRRCCRDAAFRPAPTGSKPTSSPWVLGRARRSLPRLAEAAAAARESHPAEPPAPPLRASAGVRSAQAAAHASCTAQRLPHARMAAALP